MVDVSHAHLLRMLSAGDPPRVMLSQYFPILGKPDKAISSWRDPSILRLFSNASWKRSMLNHAHHISELEAKTLLGKYFLSTLG
jgi:hypothetical protein